MPRLLWGVCLPGRAQRTPLQGVAEALRCVPQSRWFVQPHVPGYCRPARACRAGSAAPSRASSPDAPDLPLPPAATNSKDRARTQISKPSSGADSDSRSWPAETEGHVQSSAGTAAGERALAEMNVLRRSLRTAGTYRSYHLPDDDDDVPDLERSDSIVSSLMSNAGDSFSMGPAEALRAAAAAVAPGWSVSAAKFSAPGARPSGRCPLPRVL